MTASCGQLAMVLAWLLLACLCACSAARKCNGAKEFCELSIFQYSFGGTHNSGSFDLSVPKKLPVTFPVEIASVYAKDCYYENHEYNYKEQLEVGVRFFSPDFCMFNKIEIKNCHSPTNNPDAAAWGTTLNHTLLTIFDWLNANPDEIVMFRLENLRNVKASSIARHINATFGQCFKTYMDLANSSSKGKNTACLELNKYSRDSRYPDQKKLGYLIENNIRFVFIKDMNNGVHVRSFKTTKPSSYELDKFIDSHQAFVDALPSERDDEYMVMVELDLCRSMLPDRGFVLCTSTMAKEVNEATLMKDDDPRDYDAPEGTVCEGLTCAGYRSRLEVIHLNILSKGYTLGAVAIDYPQYGHLRETMYRINMANYRNIKGLPEPGLEWYEVPLVIGLVIGVLLLLIISGFCAVGCWRPRYCPTCIEKCFTRRERRKAKKELKKQQISAKVCVPVKEGQALAANQYPTGGYQGYDNNKQNIGYNEYTGNGQTPPVGVYGQKQSQMGPNFLPQHAQPYYNSQTPPVGVPGQPPSQSGPYFSPQHLEPQHNWQTPPVGVYGQPQSQCGPNSPPQLQPDVSRPNLGGENDLLAPTPQPQGGQRWPAAPPDRQSAMPAAPPDQRWPAAPFDRQSAMPAAPPDQRWPAAPPDQRWPAAPPDRQSAMPAAPPVHQNATWGANPASFPQGVAPTPGGSDFGISTPAPHPGLSPVQMPPSGHHATGHWGQRPETE